MKKGLFLVGKDVDAYLASHINGRPDYDMEIDLVVLRHRDFLEFSRLFPNVRNIFSLPLFLHAQSPAISALTDAEIFTQLRAYEQQFGLRSGNRYLHYDFFRARSEDDTLRKNAQDLLLYIMFFESLDLSRYDFLMGELSRSYYLLAYDLAAYHGAIYLSPANLGLVRGIGFVDDRFQLRSMERCRNRLEASPELKQKYSEIARAFIDEFRSRPTYKHTFLQSHRLNLSKLWKDSLRKSKNLLLEYKTLGIDRRFSVGYRYQNPFLRVFQRSIASKIQGMIYKRLLFNNDYEFWPDLIYFPLHVHPETTTSLWSEFLVDHTSQQSTSVEFLSKIVPTGFKLAVKEHPAMIGNRSRRFYRQFDRWYNVDLLGPAISQFDLIRQSKLILTLCGTVGIEALLLNRPVITMVDTYYNYFAQVIHVDGIAELERAIPRAIAEFKQDDEQLVSDLALLFCCVHPDVLNFLIDDNPAVISEENLDRFVRSICDELAA